MCIKFASCADCRKPIARDFQIAADLGAPINRGWYHVKLADTATCPGIGLHTQPHVPPGMAMDTSGALYALPADVPIGTGLTQAEQIYEAHLDATEATS
jgi:hypothetical protein